MLKEHGKLLVLLKEAGEIIGRKKLQKIVYISKQCNFDFKEKFNFHFYGPYSEELSLQIEELANLGFVNEVKENKGGYSQYKYELSSKGKEYLDLYPIELEGFVPFLQTLNNESSRFLELVSTMLYFYHYPQEEMMEKVQKVKSKQNYSVEEMDKALVFIQQITNRNSQ
ncbi:YwgA family protein [Caldalkalibacillus mannanilyticus]|uniref:YwgA family protein n=1 Tax=Caldalkalibacillus mannanilyticus TaxID=1418 RepID=UPI00046A54D2|nr:hypothetical protein [Caldalkalibacillus mannanilyticus]